ncbi:PEP-CTERM sorting domain-containing protein [Verrucomicrobiaceae bacterium R5-34]|nr:PEP-CTERM sorting domain-containing protein [Verrucomicrobiaceae bacterium R5-34]
MYNKSIFPMVAFCVLGAISSPLAAQTVDFSLTLEQSSNPGASYENMHAAGAGSQSSYAIGFQIEVTGIAGTPTTFDTPFASFCTELAEPVSTSSYTYDLDDVEGVASGRAGEIGTASSAIPAGGIGDLAAARVRALFDNHYQSTDLSEWTFSANSPSSQAFQLALWEVTHDVDLSLLNTSGSIYLGEQSSQSLTAGVALAQSWLDELVDVTTSYTSTTWDVWAIENVGDPGNQDILFATSIDSPESEAFSQYRASAVPEPSSTLLLALGGMLALVYRRR